MGDDRMADLQSSNKEFIVQGNYNSKIFSAAFDFSLHVHILSHIFTQLAETQKCVSNV